ncbi:MAG: formate dehydrogenase [Caldimonas sp.]
MKIFRSRRAADAADPSTAELDRRGLVVGAGVAGVAALAATALHRVAVDTPPVVADKPAPIAGDGYQVTPHVLRYYASTRA